MFLILVEQLDFALEQLVFELLALAVEFDRLHHCWFADVAVIKTDSHQDARCKECNALAVESNKIDAISVVDPFLLPPYDPDQETLS